MYLFKNKKGETVYVGKAKSLRDRVSSYFRSKSSELLPKTRLLVAEIAKIDHIVATSEIDALLLEANLIRKLAPKYNVSWKDGKSYPLIEITVGQKIPLVKAVRKEGKPGARYFGPYPTGSDLFSLLRFLRQLFPFVSETHRPGQQCLRSHLGLCPCPNYDGYKENISNLILFLEGKRARVQTNLTQQMNIAVKKQDFETAKMIFKRLSQIELVVSKRTKPFEYEVNPNLFIDRINKETEDLKAILKVSSLSKIECFDISNTSGYLATGAQVTFVNGLPEKKFYRRYKIGREKTGDNIMMGEVISRRLKSKNALPDLIVLDGGKTQLSVAKKVLSGKVRIKLIALAKRLETIYTDDGGVINLPPDSPAIHLLAKIRDEAHRFSRSYHFWRRSQNMLTLT